MPDHAWTSENIAAYVVGGLTPAEIARVDAHVRQCPECTAALSAAHSTDRGLQSLFADIRPSLRLEDDAVRSTRTARRRIAWTDRLPRFAVAATVLLGLCMVGALAEGIVRDGRLPMPGSAMLESGAAKYREAYTISDGEKPIEQPGKAEAAGDKFELANPPVSGEEARREVGQKFGFFSGWFSERGKGPSTPGGIAGIQGGIQGIGGIGGIGGGIQGAFGGGIGGQNAARGDQQQGGIPSFGGGQSAPHAFQQLDKREATGPIFYGDYPQPVQVQPPEGAQLRYHKNPDESSKVATVSPSFKPSEHWRFVVGDELKLNKNVDGEKGAQAPATNPPAADPAPEARRIVIRSGDMEFEVASFDTSVAAVTKLVTNLRGAFVATVNSEKLPNGKVRGSITVRTPPEHLDALVTELRRELGAAGELKGMKIGSQDITKQYTDLESRLRAARTMEERLLQIIKSGKGEIKDLLQAEKELGVWRTKIEELEGEIRYYSNLASLATLTIKLAEKEIRSAASVSENERVQAGVEVEDVDKAYQQTLAAVIEAKGRVSKSEMKQLAAGQFNASLQFELPPDAAGPFRDWLRRLGRVARLEIDRVQKAADGTTPTDAKVQRGDTLFIVQIYNLANVAPRETVLLHLAVPDVRAGFQALREAANKAAARVHTAQLHEQDAQNVTAQLDIDFRRPEEGAIRTALDAAGETVARQVTRAPDGDDTTDTKVLYRVTFISANRLSPREASAMTIEVADVDQTAATFGTMVAEAKGRQINSVTSRDQSGKATARVTYEVPLSAAGIVERFKSAGTVRAHQSMRDAQAPAGKFATARFDVTIVNRDQIVAADDGLWPQIRRGLAFSASVLLTSVTWVVFGLCVVLPWGIAGYAIYRLVRRISKRPQVATTS